MPTRPNLRPLTTTLIGGVVFLLPLIVVLVIVGQGLQLAARVIAPLVDKLPREQIGGVALGTVAALALLIAACYGAGVLARAAIGRRLSSGFEDRLMTIYPRYLVVKAMSQGLHGVLGRHALEPVLVSLDDQQQIAFEIERTADGRVVVFLPGAPDVWSGSVAIVSAERVALLAVDPARLTRALQGLGRGLAALLPSAPPAPAAGAASPAAARS